MIGLGHIYKVRIGHSCSKWILLIIYSVVLNCRGVELKRGGGGGGWW